MQAYPTTDQMRERWTNLATSIAKQYESGNNLTVVDSTSKSGELVVLGSGLAYYDRTEDTEAEIKSADYVFYCIYDNVTQIWLSRIRPDAFDLSVLYDPSVERYQTYIRMAEAMVFHVRQGKKVVAIYYGHPGIFATPAHRAIQIVRREGHIARMRPGISALDYLVADVGFDPALPGLLSYEASDMLLRQRRIDTSLHLVLWQVGVVGEFGFKPNGFENKGYRFLVEALERAYGPDWELVHYIAPQYAGVEPLIERISIGSLNNAKSREKISPLSTFYIAPLNPVATDPLMSVALGLTEPGEPVAPAERAYSSTNYGFHEARALSNFNNFKLSDSYKVPPSTAAADFMIELSENVELRTRYLADPSIVLDEAEFPGLIKRVRRLLAIPHPAAIIAALSEAD